MSIQNFQPWSSLKGGSFAPRKTTAADVALQSMTMTPPKSMYQAETLKIGGETVYRIGRD